MLFSHNKNTLISESSFEKINFFQKKYADVAEADDRNLHVKTTKTFEESGI